MKTSDKITLLEDRLKTLGRIAVAFSAGVDSTFLLKTAKNVLGQNVTALTVRSCLMPSSEMSEAAFFCREQEIELVTVDYDPLVMEEFCCNTKDRCYICKKAVFSLLRDKAEELGIHSLAEGTNADDGLDYRPGMRALEELGILSPLKDAGLTKDEIRALSKDEGLKTWEKASFACRATRIPHGERITSQGLTRIEKAEDYLKGLGLKQYRVRSHGDLARIEIIPQDMEYIMRDEIRSSVDDKLKKLGYKYVSLDLCGYRTGSMNIN